MTAPEKTKHSPKVCIFCGFGGLSKEDYIPKWLNKYIPKSGWVSDHQINTATYTAGRFKAEKTKTGRLLRGAGMIQRTLRIVCRRCNSTWMSGLHTDCKSLILAYLNQDLVILSKAECAKLAAWVTMHVMVREFASTAKAITAKERSEFYLNKNALPNWHIWVARFIADEPVVFSSVGAIRELPIKKGHTELMGHTHVSYIIAGRLIFHCVRTNHSGLFPYLRGKYSKSIGFSPIWFGEALSVSRSLPGLSEQQHSAFVLKTSRMLLEDFTNEFHVRSSGIKPN